MVQIIYIRNISTSIDLDHELMIYLIGTVCEWCHTVTEYTYVLVYLAMLEMIPRCQYCRLVFQSPGRCDDVMYL